MYFFNTKKSEISEIKNKATESEIKLVEATKSTIDKMVFFGDTIISERTRNNYDEDGIDKILDKKIKDIISSSDLSIANLECAMTDSDEGIVEKEFNFSVPTKYVRLLKDLKIDLFTLANNHVLDYGVEGLKSTINILSNNGISYIGAGMNSKEAYKPFIKKINNKTYAIFSASQVFPDDTWSAREDNPGVSNGYALVDVVEGIKKIKDEVDKIIVYMHWGIELDEKSNEKQKSAARVLVRAGADLIVGSHSHTVEDIDFIDGVPVVYSIGNFIYGSTMRDTMILEVYFDYTTDEKGKIVLKCLPSVSGYEKTWIKYKKQDVLFDLIKLQNKSENCLVNENGFVLDKKEYIDMIIASKGDINKVGIQYK